MIGKIWDFFQGKKMYMGGVAVILTGVAEMITSYSNNMGFSQDAWMKMLGGWTVIAAKSALTKKNPEPLTEPAKK